MGNPALRQVRQTGEFVLIRMAFLCLGWQHVSHGTGADGRAPHVVCLAGGVAYSEL